MTSQYSELFNRFITLTGEKEFQARTIQKVIPASNRTYLDVGAGNGDLTRHLSLQFQRCVVMEPNLAFHPQLQTFADEVLGGAIEEAEFEELFDFILCSHVLGYIRKERRPGVIGKLFDCLTPLGLLVFVYNSSDSDIAHTIETLSPFAGVGSPQPVTFSDVWIRPFASEQYYMAIRREKLPVVLSSLADIMDIIQFVAFGDSPLDSGAAAAELRELAESFRTGREEWTFTIEHEYLCISRDEEAMKRFGMLRAPVLVRSSNL